MRRARAVLRHPVGVTPDPGWGLGAGDAHGHAGVWRPPVIWLASLEAEYSFLREVVTEERGGPMLWIVFLFELK